MKKVLVLALIVFAIGGLLWLLRATLGIGAPSHAISDIGRSTATSTAPSNELDPVVNADPARSSRSSQSPPGIASSLESATSVAAQIEDESRRPVVDAELSIRTPAGVQIAKTDARGRAECRLERGSAGLVRVNVTARGFATYSSEVRVQEGRQCNLGVIRLEAEARLSGRVVEDSGSSPASATIYLEVNADPKRRTELFGRQFPVPSQSARQLGSHLEFILPPDVLRLSTDKSGRFEFLSLASGWFRVWAVAPGCSAAFSEPVELRAGSAITIPDLIVERLAASRVVEGRILAPDGSPLRGARVTLLEVAWYALTGARSNGDGRFEIPLTAGETYDLLADDPLGRACPVVIRAVPAGTRELEVKLRACKPPLLIVRDEAKLPIPFFGYELNDGDGAFAPWPFEVSSHPEGTVALTVPPGPFTLTVHAPGYEGASAGPLDPEALPPEIEVVLHSLTNAHGMVTAAGLPISGAAIEVRPESPADARLALNLQCIVPDTLSTRTGAPTQITNTDKDGRFAVQLAPGVSETLRVSAPGFAASVLMGLHPGDNTIEVALTAGGAIDGRVVQSDESPQAGLVVAATSGDGHVVTCRTDSGGTFVLEHLTPGTQWLAILAEEPARLDPEVRDLGGAQTPREHDKAFVCTVAEGGRTAVLLTLPTLRSTNLEGRIQLRGLPSFDPSGGRWDATIYANSAGPGKAQRTPVHDDGTFSFELRATGDYHLELTGRLPSGAAIHVVDQVRIESERCAWSEVLSLGDLEVTLARPALWDPSYRIVCATDLGKQLKAIVDVDALSTTEHRSNTVVAGPARLLREHRFAAHPTDTGLKVLAECRVEAGATTAVEVP